MIGHKAHIRALKRHAQTEYDQGYMDGCRARKNGTRVYVGSCGARRPAYEAGVAEGQADKPHPERIPLDVWAQVLALYEWRCAR